MTKTKAKLSPLLQQRAELLGKLIARSPLPKATLLHVRESLPGRSLLEIDLLIGALEQAEAQWQRVEETMRAAGNEIEAARSMYLLEQNERLKAMVDSVVTNEEHAEVTRIRKELAAD